MSPTTVSRPADPPRRLTPPVRYLLGNLPFERDTTFCDVGANPIHEPPYQMLLEAGACRVVGFEPDPGPFAELEKRKGPYETYFPQAVGDGGTHVLHVYRNTGMTSILKPHLPGLQALGRKGWSQIEREIQVETVALDAMAELPPLDCVKIDIQGAEKLVFENARRVMANVVAVIVEMRWMQIYEDEPMSGGVDAELRAQGFMLHKFMFNKTAMLANSQMRRLVRRANPDQLVDGDAVYLRHPGRLDALSDDQLCHLALLAGAVIESHSLVVAALDELVRRGRIEAASPKRYVDSLPEEFRVAETRPETPSTPRRARRAARAESAPPAGPDAQTEPVALTEPESAEVPVAPAKPSKAKTSARGKQGPTVKADTPKAEGKGKTRAASRTAAE